MLSSQEFNVSDTPIVFRNRRFGKDWGEIKTSAYPVDKADD
jgi:hypothetical protein